MILVMIRQGWNPPPPDDQALERMLDDMRGLGEHVIPGNATNELTERERQVLSLLSAGMDQPAIAAALGIGFESVKARSKRARRKLGATSNTQAVAIAMRAGLVR